jgi:CubicO group peptidase (beta-lactamase class C family)
MTARARLLLVVLASAVLHGAAPAEWRTLAEDRRDGPAMDAFLQQLMARNGVTALSVAVVDGGETVYARTFGVVDSRSHHPADERTVFRAASLSKPLCAFLVMKLVDEGVLDLDTPVHRYLPKPLYAYPAYASFREDPRHEQLTARLLLSHQGGLPNWRRDRPDGPIAFGSAPGTQFGYSGEGYALLQFVIETITGRDLAALAHDKVFEPLGMRDTSFLWEARFDGRFAVELDSGLGGLIAGTKTKSNAAASVITNASDYARFVAAVMNGAGLKPETRAMWLEPRVAITSRSLFSPPGTDGGANRAHKLAWTPGWGTFADSNGRALFHVGMEEGCENFAEIFLERKLGVVFLSLTGNEHSFSAPLVEYALGRAFSPLEWLEYGEPAPLGRVWALGWRLLVGLAAVAATLVIWGWKSMAARRGR